MQHARIFFSFGVLAVFPLGAASAQGREQGPLNQFGNPMKIVPRPTTAEISERDLRTRLYQFADDSMLGRQVGTIGNMKGTSYIAAEAKRLGLEPAGDNGTYFQALPYGVRYYAPESQLTAGGQTFHLGADFVAGGTGIGGRGGRGGGGAQIADANFQNVQVVYGGIAGDTTQEMEPALGIGRFVILGARRDVIAPAAGGARGGGGAGRGGGRGGFAPPTVASRFTGAIAVATVDLDSVSVEQRRIMSGPPRQSSLRNDATLAGAPQPGTMLAPPPPPPSLRITTSAAEAMMGMPLAKLEPGAAGRTVSGRLTVVDKMTPELGRNVVAILRGSDPLLRNEYVAIGAHNDHLGTTPTPLDHDSLHAARTALYAAQMSDGKTIRGLSPAQYDSALSTVNWDQVRAKSTGRKDSVFNGADDDGSGSMAVLEIAEALALAKEPPKRSVIFVWHTGEEAGLTGSRYFTDHPTVPLTSIVAQINIDMIGRGRTDDIPGGSDNYLAVVGSKRLSTDLGNLVASVNAKQKKPFKLDYEFDDSTAWFGYNNIYGRSDHFNYARKNIPIAFFFTGLHRDYHQLTDEPQYIDYPHYARIVSYIRDLMLAVANSPERPRVDKSGAQ